MKWIKRIFVFIVMIAVFLWGLMFTNENVQQVPLNLIFIAFPEMSISVLVAGSFVIGGVLGLLFSFFILGQLKARQIGLSRKLAHCQQELAQFKNKPAPETT
jgi:uncharacterized membrane protein YciS (DUF1049 family)